jgi:hypothetical protein
MMHEVKINPVFFKLVANGTKPFELRKNDRDYKVGDRILLREYCSEKKEYTDQFCIKGISYVLNGGSFGLDSSYVALGLKECLGNEVYPTASVDKNKIKLPALVHFYTQIKSMPMTGEAERIRQEILDCMLDCIKSEKIDEEALDYFKVKTKELLVCFMKQL